MIHARPEKLDLPKPLIIFREGLSPSTQGSGSPDIRLQPPGVTITHSWPLLSYTPSHIAS